MNRVYDAFGQKSRCYYPRLSINSLPQLFKSETQHIYGLHAIIL